MEYIAVYIIMTGWIVKPNTWLNRCNGKVGYIGSKESCKEYIKEQENNIK